MDLMKALTSQYMKQELPEVQVGDTVRVHVKIKEGSRERIQIFEGTVIAKKHGGIEETITVRRISYGVGCEKVFPLHAPNVVDVECVRHGKVRRAKLYYLRDRLGKAAKVKEKDRSNSRMVLSGCMTTIFCPRSSASSNWCVTRTMVRGSFFWMASSCDCSSPRVRKSSEANGSSIKSSCA